eukprot:jgi/Mesvir1/12597/Mv17926-RA.1
MASSASPCGTGSSVSPAELRLIAKTKEDLTAAWGQLKENFSKLKVPQGVTFDPERSMEHPSEPPADCAFDTQLYMNSLTTSKLGRTLLLAGRLPSSQTFLQDNGDMLPTGCVCLADTQVAGKGRGGNVWESPRGCLMFSFLWPLRDGAKLPLLQYLVCLALVQAVEEEAARATGRKDVTINIKWPNDLYARGLKVGGILCNSSYQNGQFLVVAGVGLNVSNPQPTLCINDLCGHPSSPVTREQLLASFFNKYERMHDLFASYGFEPFISSYIACWLHSNQEVTLQETDASGRPVEVRLVIKGLTPSGYLLATSTDNGRQYELHPDGNSLDFFKGLVRKKLPQ